MPGASTDLPLMVSESRAWASEPVWFEDYHPVDTRPPWDSEEPAQLCCKNPFLAQSLRNCEQLTPGGRTPARAHLDKSGSSDPTATREGHRLDHQDERPSNGNKRPFKPGLKVTAQWRLLKGQFQQVAPLTMAILALHEAVK